jgi:TP901 family phage tail tape measure protein
MSVRTDVINLRVNVNNNQAQNQLNELKKKASDISFEMKGLKKNTQEYADKAIELKKVTAEMTDLKKQIGLTALSQKELVRELKSLQSLRGSTVPFSKEYKDFDEQIKKVERRLYDVKNGVQGFSSTFSKIGDQVKQFGAVAAAYLGFQFITSQFQNIINGAGKLSDQLADLQRVAGLTASEAQALNTQLKDLDTRTSTEGLRNIAITAGKLGVAKKDLFEFTAAVDQLVVALGDELGDADQITSQLGKILTVFDGKIDGNNISKLGNAFVELANAGSATGGFIADFDQRLSGIAKSAGIGLGALSGLGAGLEELGGRVESSSTAIQKLIISIADNIPAAAKIAGLSVAEFDKLFKLDPTEALLKYSEGLVKNKSSFAAVTASFKDAGEEGARTIETISKLGTSADFLRGKIKLGSDAIKENTAITEAFNLKNETFGATLDKLSKEFNKLVTAPGITSFFQTIVEGALKLIRAIVSIPAPILKLTLALGTLIVGVALYNSSMIASARASLIAAAATIRDTAAKIFNAIATRSVALATNLAVAAQAAYITITALLTGRITIATAAQRLYNIAVNSGIAAVGLFATAIGGAVLLVTAFVGKTKELTTQQRIQADLQSKISELTKDEETKARSLFNTLKLSNLSYDDKKKVLKELISISPEYLQGLTLENIKTEEGTKILDNYIAKLRQKNEAEARNALIKQKEQEKADLVNTINDAFVEDGTGGKVVRNKDNSVLGAAKQLINDIGIGSFDDNEVTRLQKNEKRLAEVSSELDGLYQGLTENLKATVNETADANKKISDNAVDSANKIVTQTKDTKSEADKIKQELEEFQKEIQRIKEKSAQGNDPQKEEVLAVEQRYKELFDKAKNFYARKAITESKYYEDRKILIEAKEKEIDQILNKFFEKRSANEYDQALADRAEFSEKLKGLLAVEYSNGTITKKEYEQGIKQIERDETDDRITIATDYAAIVTKAQDDLQKFRKAKEKETTTDLVKETDKRLADQKASDAAYIQRQILTARNGSGEQLKWKKIQLGEQLRLDLENEDLTAEQKLLKEEEYKEKIAELDANFLQARIDSILEYVGFFQQALNSLNTILNNRDQQQFNKEKALNDRKKKLYKDQLDNKLLSQAQYDKKINQLQEIQDAKERELKRKQAKREKAANLLSAFVNTASAVAEALPNVPLSIIVGALGALQIAAIASAPLPELGKGAWITTGDKHSDPSGGMLAKIERDEAVISARAMTNKNRYTVSGTTAEITSQLNGMAGGTTWAGGGSILKPRWMSNYSYINPNLPTIMAAGGLNGTAIAESNNTAEQTNELLRILIAKQEENTFEIQNMKTKIKATVVLKEIYEQDELYNAAKKSASIAP